MSEPILNLDAMRHGYDRRCRKGCQFSSAHHKKCPEHGGRSKRIVTLEELVVSYMEKLHEIHRLKKEIKNLKGEKE